MADVLCKGHVFAATSGARVLPCASKRAAAHATSVGFAPFSSCRTGFEPLKSSSASSSESSFLGRKLAVGTGKLRVVKAARHAAPVQMRLTIGKAIRWWEKGLQSNMKDIRSAQDLVNTLRNAGDKLVIVDFFSPGCGGCKALHPKICQFAETNPDVLFLQVNYEEHKSMCYSLNVHVLPFFRFYRGAHGRLCSFSCTNATIKKFKDALAKHGTARCSLGPAKGLEESELLALAANRELNFTYTKPPAPEHEPVPVPDLMPGTPVQAPALAAASPSPKPKQDKGAVVTAWR